MCDRGSSSHRPQLPPRCAATPQQCRARSGLPLVDAGSLLLLGPSPLAQDRTCIAGSACRMRPLLGLGVSAQDRVLVLATCAAPSAALVGAFSGGALLQWEAASAAAAGGEYRLCWCSSSAVCSATADFAVDVGPLAVVGVAPLNQDRVGVRVGLIA